MKPSLSYGFPMIVSCFPHFSYGFPMLFLWLSPLPAVLPPGPGPLSQEGQAAHRHGQRLAGGYGLQDGHQEERGVPHCHEGDIGYGDGDMR